MYDTCSTDTCMDTRNNAAVEVDLNFDTGKYIER